MIKGIPDDFRKRLSFTEISNTMLDTFHILVDDEGKRINDSYYSSVYENCLYDDLLVLNKYEIVKYDISVLKKSDKKDYKLMDLNHLVSKLCIVDPKDGYEYYTDYYDINKVYIDRTKLGSTIDPLVSEYTVNFYIKNYKNNVFYMNRDISDSVREIIVYSKITHDVLFYMKANKFAIDVYTIGNNMFICNNDNESRESTVIDMEKAKQITCYDSGWIHELKIN